MNKNYLAALCLLFVPGFAQAQAVSINTDGSTPAPSAILDVKSSDKGMLVPRMTSAQRTVIAAPATGLLVFDTNSGSFWFYNGSAWANLAATGTPSTFIADTDGDTRVHTEKSPDEDVIRFDLGGIEHLALRKNPTGTLRLEFFDALGNTAAGLNALSSNTTGYVNAAFGANAMHFNTTGYYNTAQGFSALASNTTGDANTAGGALALYSNTTGAWNSAIGRDALHYNTTGSNNTAIGGGALGQNSSGSSNSAYSLNALASNTVGHDNSAFGIRALFSNTEGNNNIALGGQALYGNTTGSFNIALGEHALYNNADRSGLVALGDSALFSNGLDATQPSHSVNNTALGSRALLANTTGYNNTAVGNMALYRNTIGHENTATGYSALKSNTDGDWNTANGHRALAANTTGDRNTATGYRALSSNTTGNFNTAHGALALDFNTEGLWNTATGYLALSSNTTGDDNTATGSDALTNNTTGYYNTATGESALGFNLTGYENTADGKGALLHNTTGNRNTALGFSAGATNDNNSNCTTIGYDADQAVTTDFTNSTALGNASRITASNQVRIGNSSVTSIGGFAFWSNVSDGRFKNTLRDDVPGLRFIRKLHPLTYHLDAHALAAHLQEDHRSAADGRSEQKPDAHTLQSRDAKSRIRYTGFIAQEVEQAAEAIGYDFSGVDKPNDEAGLYGLRYAEFVAPMIKAIQEQQTQIESLQNENTALKAQLVLITAALQRAGISLEQR